MTEQQKMESYMKMAIAEAQKAQNQGEVPIGAVIIHNGEVIASAYNLRETTQNAVAHAELLAIEKACAKLGTWRLDDCELYVTLEPCAMCSGAIVLSRLKKVVYGAMDPKAGCAGTLMNLLTDERLNHQSVVVPKILEQECGALLSNFFKNIRQRKKLAKQQLQNERRKS